MKTTLSLTFTTLLACAALAQPAPNPPPAQPATPAPAPAGTAPVKRRAATPVTLAKISTEPAVPLVPGPATINGSNVNVRGQARLNSEVITRLNTGDLVTVLEEIILDQPAADEPARWARIAFPPTAHVWVHAMFIDVTNKTVLPSRLNLRSGPGENYSIMGVIERGEPVHEILTKDNWMEIEAPTNAHAFVASQYLKQEVPTPVVATTSLPVAPAAPETPPPTPAPVTEPPPVAPPTPAPAPPEPSPPPAVTPLPALPEPEAPPPPRIVAHEGLVRSTWSIQAPTKFALVDPDSGRTVNYLYTTSTNLDLSRWKGYRVVVTGEEGLDERWRNTPVLTIQRIQVLE